MLRWDVAKKLNMALDDPVFLQTLEEMDFDYEWDENVAQERVFKRNKEKRYYFTKRDFDLLKSVDSRMEQHSTSAEKRCKTAPALPSSSSGSKVEIKLENPEYFQCKKPVEVLSSSEAKVQGQMGLMDRLIYQLEAFGTPEALTKKTDLETGLKTLKSEHKSALQLVAAFKFLSKDADQCTKYKSKVEGAIRDLSAHLDAAQLMTKKIRLWLEAMTPEEDQ